MKRALVTGAAGFIGSHIVDELLSMGVQVVAIDNESAECHDNFYWNSQAENHKIDICDYNSILPLFEGVDTVFHLAAESRIQPSIINPLLAVKVNAYGTCSALQAAHVNSARRFVYSSTSSAYGTSNPIPQVEDMPRDCLTPYAVSKVCGEELCKMYYNLYGLQTISFRYFNVYGERQPLKGQYAPVIGLFMRQVENGQPCTIVGDGLQRRDYTHVSDVVRANILAAQIEDSEALGQLYNVGTGTNYNIHDLVNMLDGQHTFIDARPGEVRETLADTTKIKKLLNWEPKIHLEQWIKKV